MLTHRNSSCEGFIHATTGDTDQHALRDGLRSVVRVQESIVRFQELKGYQLCGSRILNLFFLFAGHQRQGQCCEREYILFHTLCV